LESLLKINVISEKDIAKKNKSIAIQSANLSDNEKIHIINILSIQKIKFLIIIAILNTYQRFKMKQVMELDIAE
jgi:hypothetical protein